MKQAGTISSAIWKGASCSGRQVPAMAARMQNGDRPHAGAEQQEEVAEQAPLRSDQSMLAGLSSTMRPPSPRAIPISFQGVSFSPKNSTAAGKTHSGIV